MDLSFLAFMVPMLLLVGVGFPLFGVGTLRAGVAPRSGAWLLVAGGLPGMILLDLALGQLTLAHLPINVAWVVLGHSLYAAKFAPASPRRRTERSKRR